MDKSGGGVLNLRALLNEVRKKVEDPNMLGVQLGLDYNEVKKIIRQSPGDTDRQIMDVLDLWMKNTENPSWELVFIALKDYYPTLAKYINKNYLQDTSLLIDNASAKVDNTSSCTNKVNDSSTDTYKPYKPTTEEAIETTSPKVPCFGSPFVQCNRNPLTPIIAKESAEATNSSPSRKRKVDSCISASTSPSSMMRPDLRQLNLPTDLDLPREKKPDTLFKFSCQIMMPFDFGMQLASSKQEEDLGRDFLPYNETRDLDSPTPTGCMEWLFY